jgi:hypothetical protein
MQTNPYSQSTGEAPDDGIESPGEVKFNTTIGQNAFYSKNPFQPGDIVSDFGGSSVFKQPNYLTVQISDEEHIELSPQYLSFINHSCNPNVFFDTTAMKLACLRAIQPGDELTFFYPSAEWSMAQRFQCFCGHTQCLGEIKGAAWVDAAILNKYRLTDYIQQKLKQRSQEARA